MLKPPGEWRFRVAGNRQLRLAEVHEVEGGAVEIQHADPLPELIGEVGREHGGDGRLADPALLVVYCDTLHQIKL